MTDYSKCSFCEVGQGRRRKMWNLMKDLSKAELEQMLREKRMSDKLKNGRRLNET